MPFFSYKQNSPLVHPSVFIAPGAQIIGNVHIGIDSSVWFQTVIRGDMDEIRIGERTNIQDLCVCHADENVPLWIGDGVTVGHRCVIHGCTIEDECLIGMGAIIMNRAVIGQGSVIGANALVLEGSVIPPYSLVTGSPGKVKKTYEDKDQIRQDIRRMSQGYVENSVRYRSETLFRELDGQAARQKTRPARTEPLASQERKI